MGYVPCYDALSNIAGKRRNTPTYPIDQLKQFSHKKEKIFHQKPKFHKPPEKPREKEVIVIRDSSQDDSSFIRDKFKEKHKLHQIEKANLRFTLGDSVYNKYTKTKMVFIGLAENSSYILSDKDGKKMFIVKRDFVERS